jgi:hypothetical protein
MINTALRNLILRHSVHSMATLFIAVLVSVLPLAAGGAEFLSGSLLRPTADGLNGIISIPANRPVTPASRPTTDYQFTFKVPNADGTPYDVRVSMPKSDPQALEKFSRAELAKKNAALKNYVLANCSKGTNVFAETVQQFLPEASAFYSGVAMSAQLDLQKDPGALKHFYEHNLVDMSAQASFAFFMLGSRMTTASLAMMGLHFDGCKGLKLENGEFDSKMKMNLRKGTIEPEVHLTGIRPTKLQIGASALVGPLSMGVGFLISGLAQEFMSDPNIALCGKFEIGQLDESQKEAGAKACDDGWKEWVSTGRIKKYVPDLVAMTVTSTLQAYVINNTASFVVRNGQKLIVNKAKGAIAGIAMNEMVAEGATKLSLGITLKTIMLVSGLTPEGAVVRFGMQALQAMVFVTVNQIVLPYIKTPWETWQQGTDITASIDEIYKEIDRTEKNKWAWTPMPKPDICQTGQQVPDAAPYFPPECYKPDIKPGDQIRELGVKYKKWRQFILADAYTAQGNWKDYLNRFQNTYVDAKNFYADLLKLISDRATPAAQHDELHAKLYQALPFNGLNTNVPANICSLSPKDAAVLQQAAAIAKNALYDRLMGNVKLAWGSHEVEDLHKIMNGLEALDCVQNKDMSWLGRVSLYQKAIEALNQELKQGQANMAHGASILDLNNDLSQDAFKKLAQILGDAKPLAVGMSYLLDTNSDDTIIDQKLKDDHPLSLGLAATPDMVDYLLASMTCGPEAEDVKLVNERPRNFAEKAIGWLGYDVNIGSSNSIVDVVYGGKDPSSGQRLNEKIFEVRASFKPPKIIAADKDLCSSWPGGVRRDKPFWNIHQAQFDIDGTPYQGLLEVVKNFARDGVLGQSEKDGYSIDAWWAANVEPHVLETVNIFVADFQHIVDKMFLPALTSKETKEYYGRQFELGVAASMQAEAKYNLRLLGKSMHFNHGLTKDRTRFVHLADMFLKRLKLQTDLFADVNSADAAVAEITAKPVTQADGSAAPTPPPVGHITPGQPEYAQAFDRNKRFLQAILGEMDKLGTTAQVPDSMVSLKEIRSAARENLAGLVTETDSYFGVVDTARVAGVQ